MTEPSRSENPDLTHLLKSGVIAVVRLKNAVSLRRAAEAIVVGGVGSFEVTLTTPGAMAAIRELAAAKIPGALIGAGTVLDARTALEVIDAGARFVVSPTLEPGVIQSCVSRNVVCIPGAMTPTEILTAWRLGASLVKVYPSSSVGQDFFRNILGPLPFLRMVPSGGMTFENAPEWIRAGAAAVSLTALADPTLVLNQSWDEMTRLARGVVESVAKARAEVAARGK
jgi:2-dehydro-3-deoxyphosphogluconate aldolase/(4S)-4-hydroxy-2-oxoglutarate aldolase